MDEKNNKSNIFIRKEQTKIKFRTVIIKSQRDMEMIHNKIKKIWIKVLKKLGIL